MGKNGPLAAKSRDLQNEDRHFVTFLGRPSHFYYDHCTCWGPNGPSKKKKKIPPPTNGDFWPTRKAVSVVFVQIKMILLGYNQITIRRLRARFRGVGANVCAVACAVFQFIYLEQKDPTRFSTWSLS